MTTGVEPTAADRRYASRKFILSVLLIVLATPVWILSGKVEWLPDFTTEEWILAMKWILGLYMAGNVGDGAVDKLFAFFLNKPTVK